MSVFEGLGTVLTLFSIGGAVMLSWSIATRSRPGEEVLLLSATTALLGYFGTRTLLSPVILQTGFTLLFGIVAASTVMHARKMWPDYKTVTVVSLAMCVAGVLSVFGIVA